MDEQDLGLDPIIALRAWLREADGASPHPDAMTLATASPDGRPSARVVLLREIDESGGLVFFTNKESRKGEELRANPRAALVLHWWELGRQVRVEGTVEEVHPTESEAYWTARPPASQVSAWASPQSRPIAGRTELEAMVTAVEERFVGGPVPLPDFWGGYMVVPETIEFWTHRENRLHDRVRYVRAETGWRRERLAP